jgi:acetylornithine deacetylase/succinyl-diaminopimelate desuccinylase-like protein
MKKFLSRQNGKIGFAVVGENSDLKIWNAHRGLIEIYFAIEGKTGHAANPSAGRNAIAVTSKILEDIREWLSGFRHKVLGIPSLNIAYLRGGLKLEEGKIGEIALGRQGNNIADYCEGVLDIRTTDTRLRAKAVVSKLAWFAKSHDVRLADWEVRHDLGSLYTNPQEIRAVSEIVRELTGSAEMFLNPGSRGYGDGQMIQEKLEIPVINFGPAGKNEHSAGEFVTLSSLEKASEVYRELMESWPEIRRQFSADSR